MSSCINNEEAVLFSVRCYRKVLYVALVKTVLFKHFFCKPMPLIHSWKLIVYSHSCCFPCTNTVFFSGKRTGLPCLLRLIPDVSAQQPILLLEMRLNGMFPAARVITSREIWTYLTICHQYLIVGFGASIMDNLSKHWLVGL